LPAPELTGTVAEALRICAALSVIGAAVAWLTVGRQRDVERVRPVDHLRPCHDPGRVRKSA